MTGFARLLRSGPCFLALTIAPTYAQEIVLEEVFVFAQKREENVQDVPVSMSTIDSQQLTELDLSNLDELDSFVPNLIVAEASINTFVSIRGINSGANDGFEQSVAMFVDTVYSGRGRQFRTPFLDLQRVEVLRGPQSVIYGKNTIAGVINLLTARPTEEFESYVNTWFESEKDEVGITAAVSGSISDRWQTRFATSVSESDGSFFNTYSGRREPENEARAWRWSFDADLSERLDLLLKLESSTFDVTGRRWQVTEAGAYGPAFQAFDPLFESDVDDNKSVGGLIASEFDNTDSENVLVQVDYDVGNAQLTSLTSYSGFDVRRIQDTDFSPLPLLATYTPEKAFDQTSQELRIQLPVTDSVDLLSGLLVQSSDLDVSRRQDIEGNTLGFLLGAAGDPAAALAPLTYSSPVSGFSQSSTITSLFSHAVWGIADRTVLNIGLRWTREEKDATQRLFASSFQTLDMPIADPVVLQVLESFFGYQNHSLSGSRDESDLTTSLSLIHDLGEDAMVYVSYATGFKSGGFNEEQRTALTNGFEFEDEKATSLEIGSKLLFGGGRSRLNLALFENRFRNLQTSSFDGVSFIVGNAARATSTGIELEGSWRATDSLSIGGSLALMESEFDEYRDAPCRAGTPLSCTQDLSGMTTPFAPEFSGNLFLDFIGSIAGNLAITWRVDALFTDEYFFVNDLDPVDTQIRHTIFNGRLGIGPADGAWEVALLGRNLLDKRAPLYGNDLPVLAGAHITMLNDPRTWTVQLNLRFD